MLQPLQFGKYLLLERIAVGGMAEVFVAKAFGVEGFERLLAIKKILPTMGDDGEFNTMFIDEARISVQLAHANIVQVLELGKVDDNLFIAMEYISGRDVRQLLERFRKRGKPMPFPQACTIVAKVCEALDYAHRKRDARGTPLGIVHRDVSPQNVLVSFEGDVKLIDFGIAKAESRLQRTQAGILKGKFSYMSPEQVRGQPIDHRSDVFAVGVLLWELLCGEKLFTGDSDFAVLEKVRTGQIPAPRKVNPAIPEVLERVMLKALAPEVRDRYQWASELHDALVRFTLIGDMVYGSRQLAEWMRDEFSNEFEKEQKRLRSWLGITDAEIEVTPSDPQKRRPPPSRGRQDSQQQHFSAPPPPPPVSMPPPAPRDQDHEPMLVQPPTPTGVRHQVPPSKTATPPPGEMRAPSSSSISKVTPKSAPKFEVKSATPSPGSRPSSGLKTAPPPLAAPSSPPPVDKDLHHEAPTMKMDGNVLAAAEKALALQRAAKQPALGAEEDEEENTEAEAFQAAETTPADPGPEPPQLKLDPAGMTMKFPDFSAQVTDAARLVDLPTVGIDDPTPADFFPPGASVPPPPRPVTLRDRPVAPKLPASLDPSLLSGEKLQPIPILRAQIVRSPRNTMPDAVAAPTTASGGPRSPISTIPDGEVVFPSAPGAPLPTGIEFNVSDERTQAPRAQRQGGLTRPTRESRAVAAAALPPSTWKRNVGIFAALGLVVALCIWAIWPTEVISPGRLIISLEPPVPGNLTIDGKAAGAVPPFVWSVARGKHNIEVRATGYKLFTATVKIAGPTRPTELQISLVPDGPLPVEGVVLDPQQAAHPAPAPSPAHEGVPSQPSRSRGSGATPKTQAPPAEDRSERGRLDKQAEAQAVKQAAAAQKATAAVAPAPAPDADLSPPKNSHRETGGAAKPESPRLHVSTIPPGAEVSIDGHASGKTPASIPGLDAANVHIVAISMAGYKPERRVAKVDDGHFSPLSLTLQPSTPASPVSSPAAVVSSPPDSAGLAPPVSHTGPTPELAHEAVTPSATVADPEPASGPTGYLVAVTKPVAKVFIDGRDTGRWTPVMPKYPVALPPGPHSVTFETSEGHRHEESVTIEVGKTSRVIKMDL